MMVLEEIDKKFNLRKWGHNKTKDIKINNIIIPICTLTHNYKLTVKFLLTSIFNLILLDLSVKYHSS